MKEPGIVLKLTTFIAVIGSIAAGVTAHFTGIASSTAQANVYTDKKVEETKTDISRRLDRLESKQDRMLEILSK